MGNAAKKIDSYLVASGSPAAITEFHADRMAEAFAKDAHPTTGSICIFIDANYGQSGAASIVGLGIVKAIGGIAAGTVRAIVKSMFRFDHPIDLPIAEIPSLRAPQVYRAEKLTVRAARSFWDYVITADDRAGAWFDAALTPPADLSNEVRQARLEVADAVKLAAQIADVKVPGDSFVAAAARPSEEDILDMVLNSAYSNDLEEELLPLDLQRFNGLLGRQKAASATVFTSAAGKKKLIVTSVNKKPLEVLLGVDLLYWDLEHDAFTFVQYKRLEKDSASQPGVPTNWVYTRKSELEKQLKLMPAGRQLPVSADDWRALETPFWFKFVRGDAARKLDDKALTGMHVPADWLRLAINDDALKAGLRGGFQINYKNTRYLNRGAFAQLISRGFIGTVKGRTEAFKPIFKKQKDRALIVALKTAWDADDHGVGQDHTYSAGSVDGKTDSGEPF